ncbi:putative response regulator receiver modulated methylesterase CheB [Actinoplanes missouriensis 431]|uniref:Protein-glutamate methylesterase/protein-glutamine glutaminase n=1 Tax=Actinoplanes missouriensis (strain ATCC 14538 / DSM 43046 / CBS 188.64 / JCM 3121 / NBRC 102363 / NCIMB 12654 / NRRL B-3342 / UNCC 431) TaxID=512565 RepID=I0HGF8_ACTM4|nr:chemotaxis-specific protein-glutamate methyltransferase CheB [Actinoplanes missouriensis]BAL92095.1 putative response regulator receiver modulated methylesterase CheB [Actinoplanes missouriensis 431]
MSSTSVLVVDDSALMRRALKGILTDTGEFDVHTARNGVDALEQLGRLKPDVVTLDINMPEMDGMTCLARIMDEQPTPVIMVSSLTEHNALVTLEALELGAVDYVPKPGGTVSLNIEDVSAELVTKVRAAAQARLKRAGGLTARVRAQTRQVSTAPPPRRQPGKVGAVDLLLIGSSTGGPALLSELLPKLPGTLGAPVVVAQHIPASFTAALARRLDEICALRVHEVDRIMNLQRGNIYIGRGNADVVVARRTDGLIVKSVPAAAEYRWHPSVDRLVGSARRYIDPERLVCALLTGMGDDGATEMAAVKEGGGRTVAESEETAVVWGMPGELARRGGATVVLPSYEIADQLADWVR